MEQKGREIFLRQLQMLKNCGKVIDWLDPDEEKRYLEITEKFQVPEDLREAFFAYVREYTENEGQSTRTDGVFFNDENVSAGICEKLRCFYRPLADVAEEEFEGLRLRVCIEPSHEDASAVLVMAEGVAVFVAVDPARAFRHFTLPFVVLDDYFKVWQPFFDRFEPREVYRQLGAEYVAMREKVKLGLSVVSLKQR